MSIFGWYMLALTILTSGALLHFVSTINRRAWARWAAEHPTPTAEAKPPTGAELKSHTEQTYTIPGEKTDRWKVGDEVVAVNTELGAVVISRAYADRMGIEGIRGKVVDG